MVRLNNKEESVVLFRRHVRIASDENPIIVIARLKYTIYTWRCQSANNKDWGNSTIGDKSISTVELGPNITMEDNNIKSHIIPQSSTALSGTLLNGDFISGPFLSEHFLFVWPHLAD